MRVEQLGTGTPEVAVVGGIHGDEPCGIAAVESLLADDPAVDRPVKLVLANERAIDQGVRYVDEDLNRAFPGSPDADTHEGRLANRLVEELRGLTILSLHSTQSSAQPFAVVESLDRATESILDRLSIASVVETGPFVEGRLFAAAPTVEVECGLQGSDDAKENGYRLVREFLAATGVLADPAVGDVGWRPGERDGLPVYRLMRPVPKGAANEYEVFARNFERVDPGEQFAAADDEILVAEEGFYPVLMSPYGYQDVFGYEAERVGVLD